MIQVSKYQIEGPEERGSDDPYINLWREVCRVSWSDYLGQTGKIDGLSPRNLKIEARKFLRSEFYEDIRELVGYPRFREVGE